MQDIEMNRVTTVPTVFVVFGATGDLFAKKLLPALFDLYDKKVLPERFRIVASARRPFHNEEFRGMAEAMLVEKKIAPSVREKFLSNLTYHQGLFEDALAYEELGKKLSEIDAVFGQCSNKLFYLAVPPTKYQTIIEQLASSGLTIPCNGDSGWTRVLIEKPFGKDAVAAEQLDLTLAKLFKEEQIFRIDHYLAKEAMQNILTFRFREASLESLWNRDHIESVKINLFERQGINGRGALYEGLGALRDVGQNHILSMLALIAMDRPDTFNSLAIRSRRARVLSELKKIEVGNAKGALHRGQYVGYLDEKGVAPQSQTETFFSIKAEIDSPRWRGVPFYLTSGKGLEKSVVESIVTFKEAEHHEPVTFLIKSDTIMSAYERVLLDAVRGDQTLFQTTEEVTASWEFISSVANAWSSLPLELYAQGSSGPKILP